MHLFKSSKITGNYGITAVIIDKMTLLPESFNHFRFAVSAHGLVSGFNKMVFKEDLFGVCRL